MTRSSTTAFNNAAASDTVEPFFAAKLEFESGATRIWTGIGDISFEAGSGSETFIGGGGLVGVSQVEETNDIQSSGITFTLTGIDSSLVTLALTENYQGKNATLYLGLISSGSVVADPYILFRGFMDTMDIGDTGETATIQVKAENRLVALQKAKPRRFTQVDQELIDSTDKGFEFVNDLQDKTITWGTGKADQGLPPPSTINDINVGISIPIGGFPMVSDARLKDDLEQIGEKKVGNKLYPYYRWKWNDLAEGLPLSKPEGLLAQDILEDYPDAIGSYKGYLTIDYEILNAY